MVRIGVIGQSGILPDDVLDMAAKVGKSIAEAGAVVLTGGTNGVMEAVSRGAKEAGGLVVGILPGTDATVANPYVDIPITTGMGFDYRSMVLIHSSDAVIMVSGGIGTLVELSAAYMRQKPVVVLETSGGWANRVKELAYDGLHLDQRREHYPIHLDFATEPKQRSQWHWPESKVNRMDNGIRLTTRIRLTMRIRNESEYFPPACAP